MNLLPFLFAIHIIIELIKPASFSKSASQNQVLGLLAQDTTSQDSPPQDQSNPPPPPDNSNSDTSNYFAEPPPTESTQSPPQSETPQQSTSAQPVQTQSSLWQSTTSDQFGSSPIQSSDATQPVATQDTTLLNEIMSESLTPSASTTSPETNPSEIPIIQTTGNEGTNTTTLPTGQSTEPTSSQISPPILNEESQIQTTALLNAAETINNPDHIDPKSVEEIKTEEVKIDQAKTPEEKTSLLIDFAKDKVKDINSSTDNNDFATTLFATQRLTDQIRKAQDTIQQLPPDKKTNLTKQLASFCRQADLLLRSNQLSVPEDIEQDIEIGRGKCLEVQE